MVSKLKLAGHQDAEEMPVTQVLWETMVLADVTEAETYRSSIVSRVGQVDQKGWTAWTATFKHEPEAAPSEAPSSGYFD